MAGGVAFGVQSPERLHRGVEAPAARVQSLPAGGDHLQQHLVSGIGSGCQYGTFPGRLPGLTAGAMATAGGRERCAQHQRKIGAVEIEDDMSVAHDASIREFGHPETEAHFIG